MKIDPLLEKELQERFSKDNRSILFVTRTKMFVEIKHDEWQENCSGLLVIYQKRYQKRYIYGFTIVSALDLDIDFDFELYTNFTSYTKYIADLNSIIFLAPSQNKKLKIMLVLQSQTELQELKKHINYSNENKVISELKFYDKEKKEQKKQHEQQYLDSKHEKQILEQQSKLQKQQKSARVLLSDKP